MTDDWENDDDDDGNDYEDSEDCVINNKNTVFRLT